jgi:NTP pyrophosphatase (non-canonical NTP hydrolase)
MNDYQQKAVRTWIDKPDFQITDEQVMLLWAGTGLTGEAGEVIDLLKKGIFHQHGIDKEKLSKELGDCLWYIAALCTKLDLDMNEVMEENIRKLEVRYPDGFSSEDSKKRVDVNDSKVYEILKGMGKL